MSFQTPITINKALDRIHHHKYVLPAIQREFVWDADRICKLFDSLMRGYPIGSFLFWNVARESVRQYKFYDFVLDYHQKDAPHCPPLGASPDEGVVAILDGQQRLTALNIGLRGSHAVKEPRKWWDNPDAFPRKRLYLNLLGSSADGEGELRYDFRFLTDQRAAQRDDLQCWFVVGDILGMESGADLFDWVVDANLSQDKAAYRTLERLHQVIHNELLIVYFEEESQDLEKVLNIFIRTNSGAVVLSYSDLLLSIATAQWDKLDARREIHGLVDELNSVRYGFDFSKDFVLKAGLMLSDISSVGFKVVNFNRTNMEILERNWPAISDALRVIVRLVASFGFSRQTLSADNSLLPLAYYAYQQKLGQPFLTSSEYRDDRELMRGWLTRSLLKSGVWGAGLDSLLTALRGAMRENPENGFPVGALEGEMARRGKSLRFEVEELQDLLDVEYGDRRALGVLSLLYPFMDLRNDFNIDHIFPRSRFTPAQLRSAAVPDDDLDRFRERANRLANLQLLEGTNNREKSDLLPHEWIERAFPDHTNRDAYLDRHDLGGLPAGLEDFDLFYEGRRERLLVRMRDLLSVGPAVADTP